MKVKFLLLICLTMGIVKAFGQQTMLLYDGAIPNSANSWTASIAAADIQAQWPSIGTYSQLRILSRDGHGQWGGRVLTAAIDGSSGSVTVSGATIRSAFGLRSEWFVPTNVPPVSVPPAATGFFGAFSPGDFTGDGRADILAVTRNGDLYLYHGNGLGGFTGGSTKIGAGWNIFARVFSPGDFTGDGKADILAETSTGDLYLYHGNGRGGFTGGSTKIGAGWNIFATMFSHGDFTGDAKADILAIKGNGDLYLYHGNGLGGFTGGSTKIGAGWNIFL